MTLAHFPVGTPTLDVLAARLAAHHLHGAARGRGVLADAADAADQAAADQAGLRAVDRLGRTSPASTRPRTSCRRSSSSCATPSASASSARRCPRASCCTARPAPARRCWPRPSPHESGAHVLLAVGGLVRRDVRRPRRRAHPAPVRDRAQARAGDHLHRRARRRRRPPRLGHLRRARPDAQPAAGRDGRLHRARATSS